MMPGNLKLSTALQQEMTEQTCYGMVFAVHSTQTGSWSFHVIWVWLSNLLSSLLPGK